MKVRRLTNCALRQPALWLAALLALLLAAAPFSAPLFALLFPDDPRPLYTRASFFELTLAHCELVALSSLIAAIIGVGLAIFVTRDSGREFGPLVSAVAAVGQTFPPVAVLALAVPLLGYGAAPALAALSLYAILPILEGALTGLANVPFGVRDAARGVGFASRPLLLQIELPLALPFILAGLRSAVIINIGTAAIGSSVGALSLGSPILEGLSASNPAYILQGGFLVALLAITADRGFAALETALGPR
ncbi:binding-protein-dependent transport systems inner membrane component [Methylocella silvestris BL2]|uniref:Binding-protein-dependent transport systems inner membrane component n=1 Tax=Methylocella silvestris (strain DSM 15510 / CIP 108128 / LMG 27833 / NCIMB 13906 / BL2) TaxID=395965 RepID=B8ERM3_METSB|nr:ABC transporter permease [Methylocella silvestris]ACK51075.1 binding-protein-dependent transport systems inner membrane component [Methylocella silvestris BL2]